MRTNLIKCLPWSSLSNKLAQGDKSYIEQQHVKLLSRLIGGRRNFHSVKEEKHTWSVLKHIYDKDLKSANRKYACYLLNISDTSYAKFEPYKNIWNDAELKIAVDGSADCLVERAVIHTADIVCGDFDSINPDLIEKLRCPMEAVKLPQYRGNPPNKMPLVIETPKQSETDFTKAIKVAVTKRPDVNAHFGLYYHDGSRIDHLFGLVNTVHLLKKTIILVNVRSNTVSWLLHPGSHVIQKPKGDEMCSLVAFTGPTEVRTEGLNYEVKPNHPLQFGATISTSNFCSEKEKEIRITTNKDLLWSIDLDMNHARQTL